MVTESGKKEYCSMAFQLRVSGEVIIYLDAVHSDNGHAICDFKIDITQLYYNHDLSKAQFPGNQMLLIRSWQYSWNAKFVQRCDNLKGVKHTNSYRFNLNTKIVLVHQEMPLKKAKTGHVFNFLFKLKEGKLTFERFIETSWLRKRRPDNWHRHTC